MIFNAARTFCKEDFDSITSSGEFVTQIANSIQREIANQIIHELCVNEECVIKLYPLIGYDTPETCQSEIRQKVSCVKLIRCGQCKYRNEECYCDRINHFVPTDFFCKMGREKECEDCKDCQDA